MNTFIQANKKFILDPGGVSFLFILFTRAVSLSFSYFINELIGMTVNLLFLFLLLIFRLN